MWHNFIPTLAILPDTCNKEALGKFRPNAMVKPSNDSLVQLMEFVLTKNNFHFNGDHYLQVSGTSMGTEIAQAYGNVFMGICDLKKILSTLTSPHLQCGRSSSITAFASGQAPSLAYRSSPTWTPVIRVLNSPLKPLRSPYTSWIPQWSSKKDYYILHHNRFV